MNVSSAFRLALAALVLAAASAWAPAAGQPADRAPPRASAAPNDVFGQEVVLAEKPIVYLERSGLRESAFDTLVDAFQLLSSALEKQGIKPNGPLMAIYTALDDTGFQFWAAAPVAQAPGKPLGGGIKSGTSPAGRALKFVHRGSYDSMDITYDAIVNHLDDKLLEARDLFIEQYVTDPRSTPQDELVIEIYVPLK